MKNIFAFTLVSTTVISASANEISSTSLGTIGCQQGSCYVQVMSNPDKCLYEVVYLTQDTSGKAMYATAMLAKTTSGTARLIYNQDSSGTCNAYLLQMN